MQSKEEQTKCKTATEIYLGKQCSQLVRGDAKSSR